MATIPSPPFTVTPLFMQALAGDPVINYSADDFSVLTTSIWPSPGVITATSFQVQQADNVGWAIKILAGRAVVGDYLVAQDTAITMDVSALNTTPVGTRTHRVFLVVDDKVQGGTDYNARIKVVEDFGSGASAPAGAAVLLLAAFTISPGQSNIQNANISAKPRNASAAGAFTELYSGMHIESTGYNGVLDASGDINTAPARVRYGNGRVQFSGAVKNSNAATFPAAVQIKLGTLPRYLWPQYVVYMTGACSDSTGSATGSFTWRLTIDRAGNMIGNTPTGTTPQYLMFDGISYEID